MRIETQFVPSNANQICLMINKTNNCLVICNRIFSDGLFSGIILDPGTTGYKIGDYSSFFELSFFEKLPTGARVTLVQE